MKKYLFALLLLTLFCSQALASGGLDGFLSNLNVQARADQNGFSSRISAQFSIPLPKVQAVLEVVQTPADAFMVFQLGQMTSRPPETVLRSYQAHKGQGWGVIAKNLGIKPGSKQFHALKRGDFRLDGEPGGTEKGHGKGKDKHKDKEHGKGRGNH